MPILEDERHFARAHFQDRADSPDPRPYTEARVKKTSIVHAKFPDQRIERHHLRGIVGGDMQRPRPTPECRTRRDRGSGSGRRAPERSAPRIPRRHRRRAARPRSPQCGAWRDNRQCPAPFPVPLPSRRDRATRDRRRQRMSRGARAHAARAKPAAQYRIAVGESGSATAAILRAPGPGSLRAESRHRADRDNRLQRSKPRDFVGDYAGENIKATGRAFRICRRDIRRQRQAFDKRHDVNAAGFQYRALGEREFVKLQLGDAASDGGAGPGKKLARTRKAPRQGAGPDLPAGFERRRSRSAQRSSVLKLARIRDAAEDRSSTVSLTGKLPCPSARDQAASK